MPPPRPTETYQCHNKGCQSGQPFDAAPRVWFRERGMSNPSNCPSCKAWKDSQRDEDVTCRACGFNRRIPAGVKAMYHKNEGVWTTPLYCRLCEEDPERRTAGLLRHSRKAIVSMLSTIIVRRRSGAHGAALIDGLRREVRLNGITPGGPQVYALACNVSDYANASVYDRYNNRVESKQDHILSLETNGGHFGTLSLAAGVVSQDGVVVYIASIARNISNTAQFRQMNLSTGRIDRNTVVKVDLTTGVFVVIDIRPQIVNGVDKIFPRTAFRPNNPDHYAKKIRDGKWVA